MNKSVLSTLFAALVLAGCAHHRMPPGAGGYCACGLDPSKPQVTVKDGQIALDQEILVFAPGVRGPITWSLPAGATLRFPAEEAVRIEGRLLDQLISGSPLSVALDTEQKEIPNTTCTTSKDRLTVTCTNYHTVPGVYKYSISVIPGEGAKPLKRDPPIVNM